MEGIDCPKMEWQLGKTKVFMRCRVHEPLEERRKNLIANAAIRIQKIWKGRQTRADYVKKRGAACKIQAAYRSMKQRLLFNRMRRSAITIQAAVRGMFAREVRGTPTTFLLKKMYTIITMEYEHKDENIPSNSWEDLWVKFQWIDLDSLLQKIPLFTLLKSTSDPGDHFEVRG